MSKLSNLIIFASEKNWCTRLYCTTCGALDFRRELRRQSNEEIREDLCALPQDFCERHSAVLRLVFVEIAIFPTCADLVGPLRDTPAGVVLESAISHSKYIAERRREYEQWCSPGAAKERAIERKREKAVAHKLRLRAKVESDKALEVFRNAIAKSDFERFFSALAEVEDAFAARAIGGLAYSALHKRLRVGDFSSDEMMLLERCAINFGGHWEKLVKSSSLPRKT